MNFRRKTDDKKVSDTCLFLKQRECDSLEEQGLVLALSHRGLSIMTGCILEQEQGAAGHIVSTVRK